MLILMLYDFNSINHPNLMGARCSCGQFHAWMEAFRPGSLFVPVVRVLNGNRQDAAFEGAFPL